MPPTSTQVAPAQEAGRPQPQTTVEPPGGPFIRHSQNGRNLQYTSPFVYGGVGTDPLVATPGYSKGFRIQVKASGGAAAGQNAVAKADAPFSALALITLRDAFGTPLVVGPGYEMLKLLPKYSGQFGMFALSDPVNLPSFSTVDVGGNYTFSSYLPLEFSKAYGVISMANASLLPTLQLNYAAIGSVYSTSPNTVPTSLLTRLTNEFYWLPEGVDVSPPGLGTTCQWIMQQGNPGIGSGATTTVSLPRLGGYLTTLILVMRDSTGARIDGWPSRVRIYVDGVPLIDAPLDEIQDDMQMQFGAAGTGQWARETGVLAFTRKSALAQIPFGLFDTGQTYLSTNPGTLITIEGAPWGTVSNAPATLNAIIGQVIPSGALIQGLPEV